MAWLRGLECNAIGLLIRLCTHGWPNVVNRWNPYVQVQNRSTTLLLHGDLTLQNRSFARFAWCQLARCCGYWELASVSDFVLTKCPCRPRTSTVHKGCKKI